MKGRHRNKPCWCGSQKKFKDCHYDRENQRQDNPWDAVSANKKAFSQKKCFAKGTGLGDCAGQIVKAHTVSRGPNLSKIAKNGKVTRYSADISKIKKNRGKLSVSDVGISNASVFYGFCAAHDRSLFSCIENEAFIGRPDQCLAVAFRTLSREFYGKDALTHLRDTLRPGDKGMSLAGQFQYQEILDLMKRGNEAAKKDLQITFDVLLNALVNNNAEILCSLVIKFSGQLPFMFAGAWSPFTDFYGEDLQDGTSYEPVEQIIVSSFAGENCGFISLSWVKKENSAGKVIANQIQQLADEDKAEACLQLVTKHVENIFFSPDWFRSLNTGQRKQLDVLFSSGLDFVGSPPSAKVRLGLFTLPKATEVIRLNC